MSIPQHESVKLPQLIDAWLVSGKPMPTRLWELIDNYVSKLERKHFKGESQYDKSERHLELMLMFIEFVQTERRDAAYCMFVFCRGFINCIIKLKLKEWGISYDEPVAKVLRSSWLAKIVRVMAVEDIRREYSVRQINRSTAECFAEFEYNKGRVPTTKRTQNFLQQVNEFERLLATEGSYSNRRRVCGIPQV